MVDTRTAGPSLGAVVEWSLKLGPYVLGAVLWVFTLNWNQAQTVKHDADVDRRLGAIETAANAQDRELTKRLAMIDASISELNHDLQFYIATRSNGK